MLNELCKRLIDQYQHGMPLCSRPYAEMAKKLDTTENEIIAALKFLSDKGILSRVGIVFDHRKVGASTLAALAVPETKIASIAKLVSSYEEVNHNYLRDNEVNLWFVITAANQNLLDNVIIDIENQSGLKVLNFPMETAYHIDLGFQKNWAQLQQANLPEKNRIAS